MRECDLSVVIPARNEMFLARTIVDILEHREADTEVVAVLDGAWAEPGINQDGRVSVIYLPEAVGQRAATNLGAKLARGRYIMKVDAHCSFDQGFDRKMLEAFEVCGDEVTMAPVMRNLWAFDWKCERCGSRWYQGPTPAECMRQEGRAQVKNDACAGKKFIRKMVWRSWAQRGESGYYNWKGKRSPANCSYCFDATPHFQYFNEYRKRPEVQKMIETTGLNETMSLQGSCFMASREQYWSLPLCNEAWGSWGNQGIEVACATWLTGGRVLVNHRTWYAHLFRTKGDFAFPYPMSGREVAGTKQQVWKHFVQMRQAGQVWPVSWLVKKFWPVPGWDEETLARLERAEKK